MSVELGKYRVYTFKFKLSLGFGFGIELKFHFLILVMSFFINNTANFSAFMDKDKNN